MTISNILVKIKIIILQLKRIENAIIRLFNEIWINYFSGISNIGISIYVAAAIFLNKFSMQIQGKRSAKAWIPIANLYLLGKLLKGKGLGWTLVFIQIIISILTSTTTTTVTINGETTTNTSSIVGGTVGTIINSICGIVCLALFIWAIIVYIKNKRDPLQPSLTKGDYLKKETKPNPADNLWGWKDSDSSKM